jgi:hypothetical protein
VHRRILGFRPSGALVVAVIAIVLAGAGGATAARLVTGKDIKNGTIANADLNKSLRGKVAGAAFAKVGPDGTLLASRNVGKVTRTGPGDFTVPYKRNIDKCATIATLRGIAGQEFFGFITTYAIPPTTVRVVIRNNLGVPADGQGFNLAVIC